MSESNQKEDKQERRFSQEQYEMLKRCSEKEDMTEWNEWQQNNLDKDILLQGAGLSRANLQGAGLSRANLQGAGLSRANLQDANLQGAMLLVANLEGANLLKANLEGANLGEANLKGAGLAEANLQGAKLLGVKLQGAELLKAKLQGAMLWVANLQDAELQGANLEGADLGEANLKGAGLAEANLQGAKLLGVKLQGAKLWGVNLQGAKLMEANLEKARFWQTKLQGTDFSRAIVDGGTLLDERCEVDRDTKFEAVALGNIRIYPRIRQLLEHNIRRMNWEEWYKKHKVLKWMVKPFWWMSDYGMSTVRVVGVFFLLALLFAAVYMNWAYWAPPGIVSNLEVQPEIGEAAWHYFVRAVVRPVYFSIVTMTTLGFGDMYANKGSIAGHVILGVQVILGYVLLGALITRFAVLFTAGGPAGEFAKSEPRKTAKREKGEKPKNEQKE